jgi:hypothetical protein
VLWVEFIGFYDKNRDISFLKSKCVESQRRISELSGEKIGDLNIMELQTLLQTQKVSAAWHGVMSPVVALLSHTVVSPLCFLSCSLAWRERRRRSTLSGSRRQPAPAGRHECKVLYILKIKKLDISVRAASAPHSPLR